MHFIMLDQEQTVVKTPTRNEGTETPPKFL